MMGKVTNTDFGTTEAELLLQLPDHVAQKALEMACRRCLKRIGDACSPRMLSTKLVGKSWWGIRRAERQIIKTRLRGFQEGAKILDHMHCTLAEDLSTFCSCPVTCTRQRVRVAGWPGRRNLKATKSVGCGLHIVSRISIKKQELMAQLDELKTFEFGHKGNSSNLEPVKIEQRKTWLLYKD